LSDLRAERQQITVILNEAVVRRTVGGQEVRRAQIHRLIEESDREQVDLRIIPFVAGVHPVMKGSFIMLRFPDSS
jgi:hypothetical protein